MASFKAKIGWKRRRNRENKNCLSVPFVLDGKHKIPEKEKKKICRSVPFPSDRTGNRKFQKKKKEIQKNEKIPL